MVDGARSKGRVAVVTGAGRGIGRAIALRLASEGHLVAGLDRDAVTLGETLAVASPGRFEPLVVDVRDRAAVRQTFRSILEGHGRIDALVNNAMWIRYEPLSDVSEETIDQMIAVGLKATIWTIQAVVDAMRAQGGGSIINISSPAAIVGVPNAAIYSAVKGAVLSLTRELAVEFGEHRIRVNAVAPGSTPTPGAKAIVDERGFAYRVARTPLGRLADPNDIAAAVSFLASDNASFVTGQLLCVDGGQTILL
ncbi:MAG: SDR family oxidoreductase [Chloroflexota bacterium]|nr:SDR family oxidoreductase [Chloroflexota bacterium]